MREASLLKKARIALLTAASFCLLPAQAGVVIGGTRFVYPQAQRSSPDVRIRSVCFAPMRRFLPIAKRSSR